MRRYWLDKKAIRANSVTLEGDVFHHICEVCRQDVGSKFEVLTAGQAFLVEIIERQKKSAQARIIERRQIEPLRPPHIHLAVSIPRYAKLEWIVEKAVELGVHTVHPFVSEFSFVRQAQDFSVNKIKRFTKIIEGATQQSGRGDLMAMAEATTLKEILSTFNRRTKAVGLFPYEGESHLHLKGALQPLRGKEIEEFWLFVGSEGGFSSNEVALFSGLGLEPVTMGSQILRVETACLALVSVVKYEFDSWQ